MRNAFYTSIMAALAICIASVAFAQSYEQHVSPYEWRATTRPWSPSWQPPCGDFIERQHAYINSCGEFIPSENDPASRPGTG